MNKKGQSVFFLLSIGIVFFILGLALTPALTETTGESMSSTELNCSNATVSDQNQAVCTSLDIMPFLFFGVIFGLAGILVGAIGGR